MIYGGKSYVSSPPTFSNDAKRLLICSGNTVSVFSTSTALLITELEGHKALVTSVLVVPSSSKVLNFCWTSSLDGTIRYWDFVVPELIKTVDIRLPVFSMVIPNFLSKQDEEGSKPTDVFAYISVEDVNHPSDKSKRLSGKIRKCNLTTSKLAAGVILKETARPQFITSSPSGEFFGIQNKRTLFIWKVPAHDSEFALVKKMSLHHTKNFTTLAFHPNQSIVAAGDITGRILVWRGFGKKTLTKGSEQANEKLVQYVDERAGVRGEDDADSCSTWHWHSSGVKFLSFSSDGAYLYSGGNEGVLVLWQLDTGKRKFLPRIGSPLLYFVHSPDPTLSAISCADNQIQVLQMPSLEISKSIAGIKLPCSFPDMWSGLSSGFTFDHSAGLVALPTENYRIQFYSLFDDVGISEVQICERNHQPSDVMMVVVNLVALSLDGSLMSTVETRLDEDEVGGFICLKFWASETQKKDFELSTIVYEPHRDAAISAIAFHPRSKMVVSSSYGGDFKIWVHSKTTESKDGVRESSGWVCHSVGSYKGKSMTAATFSADGSILAVAAETVITLWDPDRNYLVAVVGETYMPIANLTFVGKSEYIVSTSQGSRPQLSLWCLSKLSRTWSYDFWVEAVACMEDESLFAVLAVFSESSVSTESQGTPTSSGDGIILLFDVNVPVPVATWLVRKAKGGGLAFLQVNQSSLKENSSSGRPSALLAYINRDHEYVVFDPLTQEQQELNVHRKKGSADFEEAGRSGYASIYGELPHFDPKKIMQATIVPSERPWETIFNGPSHALPPLTKLCSAFLESLLEKRTASTG
ncbi:uncharacterized protein LOC104896097 [Beta vulgaris subsp. vulgaris]|uniref:uncharacterized protein LOC104896097 n=1 Tax=Beta vulgaris subsp. vulgaris TaxID=3555 RepID=UPI00203703E7|nr:uncharacterized protein LOC104896097 [Beta vulgaris subsp. vulgaris]